MDIVYDLLTSLLPNVVCAISDSTDAQKRLREGTVLCAVRSANGRVYGIGSEWSHGLGTLAPGHMTFDPTMGIVGIREIDVTEVSASEGTKRRFTELPFGGASVWQLMTPHGPLEWAVDASIITEASALLSC